MKYTQHGNIGTWHYQFIHATGISLDKSSIALTTPGQTEQLTATVTPADSTDIVTWSSSDTSIATVDQSGLVTCVTPGSATITATCGGYSASCSVVDLHPYPLSEYSLNKTVSMGISNMGCVWISKDEDFIFATDISNKYIRKFSLATPGDISSTKTQVNAISLGNYISPIGITISDDGLHLYFTRYYSSTYGFNHWTLSSPYDLSSYTQASTSVSNGQPTSICIGDGGKNIFVGGVGPYLNKYSSEQPYGDTYTTTTSTPPISGGMWGISIIPTSAGGSWYINNNGTLRRFDVSNQQDFPSGTASETLSVSGGRGMQFSKDFEKFWTQDGSNLYEYKHNS